MHLLYDMWIWCSLSVWVINSVDGKLVDLSHLYEENMLYFPTFFPFDFKIMNRKYFTLKNNGKAWSEYNKFTTPEHLGTHIDAPSHLSTGPGRWRLHQIPIDRFVGDAVVIDISSRSDLETNPDNKLLVEDILQWEKDHGMIKEGSIVFMNSGWDQYWGDKLKFMGSLSNDTIDYHWPGISPEAATWLLSNRNISGVGTDTMSLDSGDNCGNYPAHITLLSNDIYGLENVKNLGKLPASGARAYVFPMNIRDGSGAPCRILAEFGDTNVINGCDVIKHLMLMILLPTVGHFVI